MIRQVKGVSDYSAVTVCLNPPKSIPKVHICQWDLCRRRVGVPDMPGIRISAREGISV